MDDIDVACNMTAVIGRTGKTTLILDLLTVARRRYNNIDIIVFSGDKSENDFYHEQTHVHCKHIGIAVDFWVIAQQRQSKKKCIVVFENMKLELWKDSRLRELISHGGYFGVSCLFSIRDVTSLPLQCCKMITHVFVMAQDTATTHCRVVYTKLFSHCMSFDAFCILLHTHAYNYTAMAFNANTNTACSYLLQYKIENIPCYLHHLTT